jgi:hypothetical protein
MLTGCPCSSTFFFEQSSQQEEAHILQWCCLRNRVYWNPQREHVLLFSFSFAEEGSAAIDASSFIINEFIL